MIIPQKILCDNTIFCKYRQATCLQEQFSNLICLLTKITNKKLFSIIIFTNMNDADTYKSYLKRTVYVGGLAEEVDDKVLKSAFIPFGDIVDVQV